MQSEPPSLRHCSTLSHAFLSRRASLPISPHALEHSICSPSGEKTSPSLLVYSSLRSEYESVYMPLVSSCSPLAFTAHSNRGFTSGYTVGSTDSSFPRSTAPKPRLCSGSNRASPESLPRVLRTSDCSTWLPVASGHFWNTKARYPVRSAAALELPPSDNTTSLESVLTPLCIGTPYPGLRMDTFPSITSDVAETLPSRVREFTVTEPGKYWP